MTSKKGFIPVMLTPFKKDGSVDFKGLTALTEFYLEKGAAGLFANCLSSEMFELTEQERLAVTKQVVDVTAGAVPIVATGTFPGSITEQASFSKRIYETGIDAVIVITGLLAQEQESDEVFAQNVHQLLDQTESIPMGFYECPVPYKRVISAELLGDFCDTGRIIYHKDTCLDLDQIKAKLSTIKNPNFGLYDAYMVHAFESLQAGAAGLSCIQGNYFPELIVWICEHYNDASKAEEIALVKTFLIDHMEVMHNVYPITSKYALQQSGLPIETFTRRKVGTFNSAVQTEIDLLIRSYQSLCSALDLNSSSNSYPINLSL